VAATFQRARSQEQREERRQAILATAAGMLEQMPTAALSLNELSRRVGLAKSNVLRYFESREAVLLTLLGDLASGWLQEAARRLPPRVDAAAGPRARVEVIAADLADSFAAHPVMCDLISAQAGVLEHNLSTEIAAQYKRAALNNLDGFAALLRSVVPELGQDGAARAASLIIVLVGALWTHTHPAPAMLAAIQADPTLAAFHNDFAGELTAAIRVTLCGLLAQVEPATGARPPATSR
jgi:AcrR family transcriptional regulator